MYRGAPSGDIQERPMDNHSLVVKSSLELEWPQAPLAHFIKGGVGVSVHIFITLEEVRNFLGVPSSLRAHAAYLALYNQSHCSPGQQRLTVWKACEVAKPRVMKEPHFPAF